MSTFVLREIEYIKARERVFQLVVDGNSVVEMLRDQCKGTTYGSEIGSLLRYIEHFANGNSIGNRLVILKNSVDGMEYEFRSKHLRIYGIQRPGYKVILFGAFKKHAKSLDNIKAFRSLKQRYLQSLKS